MAPKNWTVDDISYTMKEVHFEAQFLKCGECRGRFQLFEKAIQTNCNHCFHKPCLEKRINEDMKGKGYNLRGSKGILCPECGEDMA